MPSRIATIVAATIQRAGGALIPEPDVEGSEMSITFGHVVPILRMLDVGKTREFYIDFLGFVVDWEHRFEPKLPLYMQISRSGCVLHLSEHHGDGTPGSRVRVETAGIEEFHRQLTERDYGYARPGLERAPWGELALAAIDPVGNHIVFYERTANGAVHSSPS